MCFVCSNFSLLPAETLNNCGQSWVLDPDIGIRVFCVSAGLCTKR